MQYQSMNPRTHFYREADAAIAVKDDDSRNVYLPPARVFVNGQLMTHIWANQIHRHDITDPAHFANDSALNHITKEEI